MSAGPIAEERAAFKPTDVSTPAGERVCFRTKSGRGYCGRSSAKAMTTSWVLCVCADCRAAGRADGLTVAVPEGMRV